MASRQSSSHVDGDGYWLTGREFPEVQRLDQQVTEHRNLVPIMENTI